MTEWKDFKLEQPPCDYQDYNVYDGCAVMPGRYIREWNAFINPKYGLLINISHWIELPEPPGRTEND